MIKYVAKKLLFAVFTVFLVMTLNFVLIHTAPGDPVSIIVGPDNQDPVLKAALMESYGLDQPLTVQYVRYMGQLFKGNLRMMALDSIPEGENLLTGNNSYEGGDGFFSQIWAGVISLKAFSWSSPTRAADNFCFVFRTRASSAI